MGKVKQLLPWRGRSLLRHGVDHALASALGPVTVVLGAHFESLTVELAGLAVTVVQNIDWNAGMGSSIACGIRSLEAQLPEVDAALILLCDQPRVDGPVLRRLAAHYRSCPKRIVASAYSGTVGVPAIFHRSLFGDLKRLPPDRGAKAIFSRHADVLSAFDVPEAAQDIDTPADFASLVDDNAPPVPR